MAKGGIYGCMLTAAGLAVWAAWAQEETRSILETGDTVWLLAPAALVLLAARSVLMERLARVRQRR